MMTPITFMLVLLLSFVPCSSSTPALDNCSAIKERVFNTCMNLTLEATLQYSFDASNSTLSVVFEAAPPNITGWVAWGFNPTNTTSIGAQVIVCFKNDNGLLIKTYDIKTYFLLVPGKLLYDVWELRAEMAKGRIMIFAKVKIPQHLSTINIVWQTGADIDKQGNPLAHYMEDENLHSTATIKLTTWDSIESLIWWRKAHAIINIICWGIVHQIGAIEVLFGKNFMLAYPLWFYEHVCCQTLASIGGICGIIMGLVMGSKSHGLHFNGHLLIGVILGVFAMVQIYSVFLMRRKDDKNVIFGNIFIGAKYVIIFVAPFNIFTGFDMMNVEKNWIELYEGWLIAQGVILVLYFIIRAVIKKWIRPADQTGNPGYVKVKKPEVSGIQLNQLDNH